MYDDWTRQFMANLKWVKALAFSLPGDMLRCPASIHAGTHPRILCSLPPAQLFPQPPQRRLALPRPVQLQHLDPREQMGAGHHLVSQRPQALRAGPGYLGRHDRRCRRWGGARACRLGVSMLRPESVICL